jgi:ATP-dependent RNA helicase DDX31/DBP7
MLFRSDSSFQSFADILSDLKQMMQKPEAFIHLSIKDQWRVTFGNKCHGREKEKMLIMEAASKVTGIKSNDALFEALALLLPRNKQQVVMVTGQPGAGKSRLVTEASKSLENQGWLFLSCKFDRIMHSEPLSIIAGAFDEFLKQCYGQLREKKISAKLNEFMQPHDISILAKHVPTLTKYIDGQLLAQEGFEVRKEQIHELFSQLLEALSATSPHALFLFLDDLQWADPASIALFHALTKASEPVLSSTDESKKSRVLFVGTYRNTELDTNPQLVQMLDELRSTSSVEVTDVVVGGFNINTLNNILSEALCVPLRRTKGLADIILQKTQGLVIHIIEFVGRLVTDRILCHSFVKGWEWSNEVIESCQISDSVAELLTFKLKDLPDHVLLALNVCSFFGIQIDKHTINFINDFDGTGSVDIVSGLKVALETGIVEMVGPTTFKFVHDLVSQVSACIYVVSSILCLHS